jgi:hypothetical protein
MKIFKAVGKNGANEYADVKVVQACLNTHVKLNKGGLKAVKEDGRCGAKTIEAIGLFQKHFVSIQNPDYRVDPDGKTIRYLTMYADKSGASSSKPGIIAAPFVVHGLDSVNVSYANNIKEARQLVSAYSINVIKMALKESGMSHAVITSTLRTPEDQAAIMLKNAKVNLASQKNMYAAAGKDVLQVYEKNKNKSDSEIIELMAKKIQGFMDDNVSVSNHCFSLDKYALKNIFDIGVNSTKAKSKNFNKVKFTAALKDLASDGYISRVIDETAKSNNCWHVEIVPNVKQINFFDNNSILFPIKLINGAIV